jgi:hypothetical protein
MKNTKTNKIRRTITSLLAAVMMMTTFAAISAGAEYDENLEIKEAAIENLDLEETWIDVIDNPYNDSERDIVEDLLERLGIDCVSDAWDYNIYKAQDGTNLTHQQVLEIIRTVKPEGLITNELYEQYKQTGVLIDLNPKDPYQHDRVLPIGRGMSKRQVIAKRLKERLYKHADSVKKGS